MRMNTLNFQFNDKKSPPVNGKEFIWNFLQPMKRNLFETLFNELKKKN